MSPSIWNSLIHHPDPDVKRCAVLWQTQEPPEFSLLLEQARCLLDEGHDEAAYILLLDMGFGRFPQDFTVKACLDLAKSSSPSVRRLAIESLDRLFWSPSFSLAPQDSRAILDCFHTLVGDTSPDVRETVQWRLILKGELSLDAITETPWPPGTLTRYCLDKGIFSPMIPEFLLKTLLAPYETLRGWLRLNQNEPFWFHEVELLGPISQMDVRFSGIHELIRLFFLAEPETCQALGIRLLNEALLPIREVGAVLLGIAEKTSEMEVQTSSPEDPDSKRLALLAHLVSQSGTQTLRQMLTSKEERDLEVAARALLWRSAWDPAALALILRVPDIHYAWMEVEAIRMAVAPAWLWQVDFAKRFKTIGEDLPTWYLLDADIPIAPETVPQHCTVVTRATMALCQSSDPAAREIGCNIFYNSGDFRIRPILDDFFKTMMKDPDPLTRSVGMTCFIQKNVSWQYFLDNPLDEDEGVQSCFAYYVTAYCHTPERTLILKRILREGHPPAAIQALEELAPSLSVGDYESHMSLLRKGLKTPECRKDALSTLLKRPLPELRTELEELGYDLFKEIADELDIKLLYQFKPVLNNYITVLMSLGGFEDFLNRLIDQFTIQNPKAADSTWALARYHLLLDGLEAASSAHAITPADPPLNIYNLLLSIPQTALRASKCLGRLGTPQALETLKALSHSTDPYWRRVGAAGLAFHPSPEAFSALQAMLQDESMMVKRRVCLSLAHRQEKEALDLLESLIQAPFPEMRRAAALACMSVEMPDGVALPSIANTFAGFCRSCHFTENASTLRGWQHGGALAMQLLRYATSHAVRL